MPPQLPFSRDATISKPHESETFKVEENSILFQTYITLITAKMIMKAEMIGAKDQTSVDAKMFEKNHTTRPSSQTSDLSEDSRTSVDVSKYYLENIQSTDNNQTLALKEK